MNKYTQRHRQVWKVALLELPIAAKNEPDVLLNFVLCATKFSNKKARVKPITKAVFRWTPESFKLWYNILNHMEVSPNY